MVSSVAIRPSPSDVTDATAQEYEKQKLSFPTTLSFAYIFLKALITLLLLLFKKQTL